MRRTLRNLIADGHLPQPGVRKEKKKNSDCLGTLSPKTSMRRSMDSPLSKEVL